MRRTGNWFLRINKKCCQSVNCFHSLAIPAEEKKAVACANDFPDNIQINYSIGGENPKFFTDPEYLKQILTNLIVNAVQAMPDGGEISTKVNREDSKVIESVKDTGQGIPHEVRERIFTPLVTTKPRGQGFVLAVIKKLTEA